MNKLSMFYNEWQKCQSHHNLTKYAIFITLIGVPNLKKLVGKCIIKIEKVLGSKVRDCEIIIFTRFLLLLV